MVSPVPTNPEPATEVRPPANRPSPVLLIFLVFPLIGLAAALILAFGGGQPAAQATPEPVILPPAGGASLTDRPAPAFELPLLDGGEVGLEDYRGRVVFLNFWATWCVPCERELPAFEAFMRQQPPDGAVVLAVNIGETAEQVRAFLDERGIDGFPVALDTAFDVRDRYAIFNIPVTFVIDPQGVIRFPRYGEMTLDDLNSYLDQLG